MPINSCVKILAGIACCFIVAGVVVLVLAVNTFNEGFTVDMVAENKTDFTLTVDAGSTSHGGFTLLLEGTLSYSNCETTTVAVTNPNNDLVDCIADCGKGPPEWMTEHDLPLQRFCHFSTKEGPLGNQTVVTGDYHVVTSRPVWAYDVHEELGEAIGGFILAIWLWALCIILFVLAAILLLIALCCICCGRSEEKVERVHIHPHGYGHGYP